MSKKEKCYICHKKPSWKFETMKGEKYLCSEHKQKSGLNSLFGKRIDEAKND